MSVSLHCVFHSIRFKVNKGWSTAVLLFLCLFVPKIFLNTSYSTSLVVFYLSLFSSSHNFAYRILNLKSMKNKLIKHFSIVSFMLMILCVQSIFAQKRTFLVLSLIQKMSLLSELMLPLKMLLLQELLQIWMVSIH